MSVDDRLRRGLEANAARLEPEGELRLVAVHRRHRRRAAVLAGAAVAAAVLLVAGTGALVTRSGAGDDSPTPPVVTEPTEATTSGRQIPDSSWTRVATAEEARRLGVARSEILEQLGDDGRLFEVLTFRDGRFSQSGRFASDVMEVGDFGTVSYTGGRLVLTSSSPGCPGCVSSLRWRLRGDQLVLDRLSGESTRPVDRLIYEGTWNRRRE